MGIFPRILQHLVRARHLKQCNVSRKMTMQARSFYRRLHKHMLVRCFQKLSKACGDVVFALFDTPQSIHSIWSPPSRWSGFVLSVSLQFIGHGIAFAFSILYSQDYYTKIQRASQAFCQNSSSVCLLWRQCNPLPGTIRISTGLT